MKRDLDTLKDYLFDQLDAVTDTDLTGDELQEALDRAHIVSKLSESLVHVGVVQVQAVKAQNEYGLSGCGSFPELLGGDEYG